MTNLSGFTPSRSYDTKIGCQNYFNAGRNTIYLPQGKVKKENAFVATLRIASWFTGFAPLITIAVWGIANKAAQSAVKERKAYWSNLAVDNSTWDVDRYRNVYFNADGSRKDELVKIESLATMGFASWFANTGVPKTPFSQVLGLGHSRAIVAGVDGYLQFPPPPNDAKKMLLVGTVKNHFDRGDVGCPAPEDFNTTRPIVRSNLTRIPCTHNVQKRGNIQTSSFPKHPNIDLLKVLWSGETDSNTTLKIIHGAQENMIIDTP